MTRLAVTVVPVGLDETGPCPCCGRESRCAWGTAHAGGRQIGVYYLHWTLGHVAAQGANIDMVLGDWDEGAGPLRRSALAMVYRMTDKGPSLSVIDAKDRPVARSSLAGRALARGDVIGAPVAKDAFDIADAIFANDGRVIELLGAWTLKP